MHLAYLTTDEVNQAHAYDIASALDLTLSVLTPRDGPPDTVYNAVLCDWDSWPEKERADFFAMSACDSLPRAVAVHGYNLTAEDAIALLNVGVLVYRKLRPQVIKALNRVVAATKRQMQMHRRDREDPDYGLATAS